MVLKDIKNEPSVGGGLKRPLSSLKRMSEFGCLSSLPCKSKFVKDDLGQDLDTASAALRSEQNQNIGTDLTNSPLALQERERNESHLSKMAISGLGGLKINDGIISPVLRKANLRHDVLFSSDSYSEPTVSGISNMSLSYFADPTAPNENEEQDSTEISSKSDKYFSTPMPSRERVKQKLAPIMEVDIESNMSDDCHTQKNLSMDLLDKKSYTTNVLLHESPSKTPLYRSFFAAECQEIVNQIENIVTDVRTPSKRKMEEVDVSTIDAEPPPYDCTPMKLACEVSKMIGSLENSPSQEGLSKFGESLLDLEKTDMQLNDFNLSECQIKNDTRRSVSDNEGLSLISDVLDGVYSKRPKTEPCKTNECKVNQELKILSPPYISATSKSGDERRTCVISSNLLDTEQELSDSVMILGMAAAQVVSQVLKTSPQSLVTARNSPVHNGPSTTCIKQMGRADEHNLCANSTQDIEVTYDDLQLTDTIHVIEKSKVSTDPRPSITSIHEESTMANATHLIEIFPPTSNTTQDLPFIQEEVNLANTTKMIEMVELPSANRTLDLSSMHNDSNSGCTVQVMVAVSANTTHIIPVHEGVAPTNTTQNIDVAPQILADTTQDIPSMQESKAANTAHVIEAVAQACVNAAQDNAPVFMAATPAVTTPVEIVPKASSDGAPGKTSTFDSIPTYCTQDAGVLQKSSVDVPRAVEAHTAVGVTCVTTVSCTLVSPPVQANPNVTEGQKLEGSEKNGSNCGPEMTASQTEVDVGKESGHQPLLSESYSMIQEEENAHDISVFSVGSLSFVTSTPVPGLNDFQYQKTVMDPVQQDPSISIGSVLDESANKVTGLQRMNTPHNALGLNCKEKRETSTGSSIPLRMQRGMAPPSEVMPKLMTSTSGIPSARRSLALYQNASQNPATEPAVSKIAQRGGIPGRGIIRPPMVRESLPRASLGNPKQATEGIGGSSISKPAAGSRFRTPKATALKVKSATAHSQLPPVNSSVKPPSRLGVPCTTRQLSTAGQNAETVLGGRPPISTGIGRGLPRPGTSSVCPTLPQSQKVSLKPKSQVQGLTTKKNPRELTCGSQREIGAQAEDTSAVRSSSKQPLLALSSATEASSQASCPLNQTVQAKAETHKNEQCLRPSKTDVAKVPAVSIELADSRLDQCQHLEICKCCQVRYRQLVQENEDLKKCLGK